jgi:hypothetical protein
MGHQHRFSFTVLQASDPRLARRAPVDSFERIVCGKENLPESSLQHFVQEFLFLRGKFLALRGQIEDVNGFLPFRID